MITFARYVGGPDYDSSRYWTWSQLIRRGRSFLWFLVVINSLFVVLLSTLFFWLIFPTMNAMYHQKLQGQLILVFVTALFAVIAFVVIKDTAKLCNFLRGRGYQPYKK